MNLDEMIEECLECQRYQFRLSDKKYCSLSPAARCDLQSDTFIKINDGTGYVTYYQCTLDISDKIKLKKKINFKDKL